MLVGEAPGRVEAAQGRPFVGKSGKEQDWYLTRVNLSADRWYKTNVCKEYVESNPDPTSCQLSRYRKELQREVVACQPRLIVAVGRFAARTFLGDTCDMEMVHGLPHRLSDEWTRVRGLDHTRVTVIPVFHPAAGFYDNDRRAIIAWDYSQIHAVLDKLKNTSHVWTVETLIEHAFYKDVTGAEMANAVKGHDTLSFDTEGVPACPWSIQISPRVGTSFVLRCTQPDFAVGIAALQRCANTGTLFIVHNAMYDLEMCREMGLDLGGAFLWDTMYAAYLMRLEPQGLKALAYRWCGIHMSSYRDTVGGAGRSKQLAYLRDVYTRTWPAPDDELLRDNDGTFRVYKPKPIETRVEKIMTDILSEGVDDPVDVPTRWKGLGNKMRRQVERVCGPLPVGTLDDIPLDGAVAYSALDADATFRLYYLLADALSKQGLTDLMNTGMEVLPMFEEMQANGMPVSISKLRTLSLSAQDEMNKLRIRLSNEYRSGRPFNPGSSKDVGALMRRLELTSGRRTPTGKLATGKKEIEHLRAESPAMDYVLTYREWSKVDGTFCRPVLERFEDGDITADIVPVHCRIKTTRTASRRLSMAEPNLMAVPIRSALGKQVRDAYTCVDGEVFGAWDLCLVPYTRVLCADLVWRPVGDLRKGDRLVAIDESHRTMQAKSGRIIGRPRRLQTSIVERTSMKQLECCTIMLSNGNKLIASLEHPWLVRNLNRNLRQAWKWCATDCLEIGDELCRLVDPWDGADDGLSAEDKVDPCDSVEKTDHFVNMGWLSGMFDGEGSFDRDDATITLTQRAGPVMSKARKLLAALGYDFHKPYTRAGGYKPSNKSQYIWMCGVLDCMRLVGTLRPVRFLEDVERLWVGKELRRHRLDKTSPNTQKPVTVLKVRPAGVRYVTALQTSTKTFVAEGFFTHNSQIEMRVMADESKDETLIRHYAEDRDVHVWTAGQIFGIDLQDVHPMDHRYPAKRAAFGIVNSIAGEGLFVQLRMMGCKGWSPESCTKFIAQWLKLYPGVKRFQLACAKEIKRTGYIDDRWGFRRHLPGVWSDDIRVRSEAERTASSHMIQGGAQGWIQNSMAWLYPRLRAMRAKGLNVHACLQVHDEIVLRFDEGLWEVLDPLMHEALCDHGGTTLDVPVKAEGHMSKTWGGLK